MKKERKLKLVMNKVKISQLNALHGGTNSITTVASVILCATDEEPTFVLACNTNYETCDDPTSATGDTKTINSLVDCIISERC